MKTVRLMTMVALMSAALTSCSVRKDLDRLEDRLVTLESRVKAIEAIIPSLNNNIETLKVLAGGGTISSVENKDGIYTITLSNGKVLTLTQGSIGVANAPLLAIDKDGYWLVDYQDGNGFSFVLCNGSKVRALGNDGVTPQIGVDEGGFWTISYDGGTTWEQVLNNAGNPVSAVPSEGADEYFEDVTLENGEFTIVLKTGESVSLQVVPDFTFRIVAPEGLITFEEGEAKAYVVVSEGVVSASVITKPEGFEVVLTEKQLLVKAVGATKASADSEKDISVLALSEEGFASLAKLTVEISN